MKCGNCKAETRRIIYDAKGEHCPSCSRMSETGRGSFDGILTRKRTNHESYMNEADLLMPFAKDPATGQVGVNQTFARLYPNALPEYFAPEEIRKAGFDPEPSTEPIDIGSDT